MDDERLPVIVLGDPEAERLDVLRAAQGWVVAHPAAAQSLFAAFVAEGRRHAATPEGAALRAKVARSDLARRGRVLWEGGTLNVLEESPEGPLPGRVVEAMAQAAATPDLERMLARLFGLEA